LPGVEFLDEKIIDLIYYTVEKFWRQPGEERKSTICEEDALGYTYNTGRGD